MGSINISNSLYRQQLKRAAFNRKTNNVNPKKGPFHYRAPSKIFHRVIRGMTPHKTARGAAALDRLTLHDGCPHPYDMKILRIKPHRKFCILGDLAHRSGWKCQDLLKRLESRRRARADEFQKKRVARVAAKAKIIKTIKA